MSFFSDIGTSLVKIGSPNLIKKYNSIKFYGVSLNREVHAAAVVNFIKFISVLM